MRVLCGILVCALTATATAETYKVPQGAVVTSHDRPCGPVVVRQLEALVHSSTAVLGSPVRALVFEHQTWTFWTPAPTTTIVMMRGPDRLELSIIDRTRPEACYEKWRGSVP